MAEDSDVSQILLHQEAIRQIRWSMARRTQTVIDDMITVRTYNDAESLADRLEARAREIRELCERSKKGEFY